MNGKLTMKVASVMAALALALAGSNAKAAVVYENNFTDLTDTLVLGTSGVTQGIDADDSSRTSVWWRTPNTTGDAVLRTPWNTSNYFNLDVSGKDFTLEQVARFTSASTGGGLAPFFAPQISVVSTSSSAVGSLAWFSVFQRQNGNFQLQVARRKTGGGIDLIVNESVAHDFGTNYRTLAVTRTNAGVWSVSDDGTDFISGVAETPGTLSGVFNYIDTRQQDKGQGATGVYQYIDNLKLSSTIVPEPASLALLGTGLLLMFRRSRR